MRAGHNQYAPMTGVPALRKAIANKRSAVRLAQMTRIPKSR
jgi:methionine aminotransferase